MSDTQQTQNEIINQLWDKWYKSVLYVMNSISIAVALSVLFVTLLIYLFGKRAQRRATFHLVIGIALMDVLFAISHISISSLDQNYVCYISGFLFLFSILCSLFLNMSIALNLQLLLLYHKDLPKRIELYYYAVSIGAAAVITSIPMLAGAFGYDTQENSCWFFEESSLHTIIWQISILYGWIIFGVLYCTAVIITILYRLISNRHELNKFRANVRESSTQLAERKKNERVIHRTIIRVLLYPMVPCLTLSLSFISTLYFFIVKDISKVLWFFGMVTLSARGTITGIVFCFDPVVYNAWKSTKLVLVKSYFPDLIQPTTSEEFQPVQSSRLPTKNRFIDSILSNGVYYCLLSRSQKNFLEYNENAKHRLSTQSDTYLSMGSVTIQDRSSSASSTRIKFLNAL